MTNNEAPSQEWADAKAADDAKGVARITDHRTRASNRRTSATFPANAAELDNDHCHACGFDLGTHRPTCPTLTDNPNRPTSPDYCATCGEIPWHRHDNQTACYTTPAPLTESIAVSDLISLLNKETGITRTDLYTMIARAADKMDLGPR